MSFIHRHEVVSTLSQLIHHHPKAGGLYCSTAHKGRIYNNEEKTNKTSSKSSFNKMFNTAIGIKNMFENPKNLTTIEIFLYSTSINSGVKMSKSVCFTVSAAQVLGESFLQTRSEQDATHLRGGTCKESRIVISFYIRDCC